MSFTVDPPSILTVPGPSPLPPGWTAVLRRFDLDNSQAPPRRIATLRLTGPGGVSFDVTAVCPDTDLWGLTASQVALYLWPRIAAYTLATIAEITNPARSGTPVGPISVPVVFV